MGFSKVFLAVFALASDAAGVGLSPNSELPMGYTAVPMAWTGPIEKGGQNYIFAGTHQQVTEQIKKANPDFSWSDLRDNATEASVRGLQIESRATDSKGKILCNVGGCGAGMVAYELEVSNDLIGMSGSCGVAAGPRVCAQLACKHGTAAWLCNDNAWPIAPTCSYLGGYVVDIVQKCHYWNPEMSYYDASGQEFDTDNYNVITACGKC